MASTSKLTGAQKQEIFELEQRLGRKLTAREFLWYGTEHEFMERVDHRSEAERAKAMDWTPKLTEVDATHDSALAAIDAAEEEARLMRTPAGRKRLTLLDAKANKEAREAHEAGVAKKKPLIERLVALKEKTKWDAAWAVHDVELIDRSIKQLTTEGACEKAGLELANSAFTLERQKKIEAHDTVAGKAHELGLQRIALEIEINALEAASAGQGGDQ
jgi:hypothetical protein